MVHSALYGKSHRFSFAQGKRYVTLSNKRSQGQKTGTVPAPTGPCPGRARTVREALTAGGTGVRWRYPADGIQSGGERAVHHELTVWSRGIIMDKEARDVSTCIATAARKLGYHAENVSDYVDDPDRTNCLVRRYARFADEPILDRFVYENPQPDWVVLVEETIIKAVNFFRKTLPARGVLVVNSARNPEYLLKFLPEPMLAKLDKLVVVDATGLAEQRGSSPWMFVRDLSELAFDRMSTEGAVERLAIGRGIAAPLIGALVAATGVLPVEAVAEVVADRDAMLRGARQHAVVQYAAA